MDAVQDARKAGGFQNSSFGNNGLRVSLSDVQLLNYLRLFILLGLLQPSTHCREYIQLLHDRLGFET